MIKVFWFWAWVAVCIYLHEFAHYLDAKHQRIYYTWGIGLLIIPNIKMTNMFRSRWDYLNGLYFSALSFPLYLVVMDFSMDFSQVWQFFFVIVLAASLDILVCIFYNKIKEKNNKSELRKNLKFLRRLDKLGIYKHLF